MPKFRQGRKPTSNQQLLPSPKGTSRHSFSQGSGSDSDSDTSNIQDAEDLHFVEMAHSVQVLSGLNSLRLSRIFCDVTLCVDDQEFTCHKIVLASFSPYFKAMFTGELSESQQDRVTLNDVDASTIRQLVDYAYTSEIDITKVNVQSLLSAANLLEILPVRDACCSFLEKNMDKTNCLGIHCFAEAHACSYLQERAKAFTLRYFFDVILQEEFLHLSSTKLIELISDDVLEVEKEEDVFEAVMMWYDHDPEARGPRFEKVLEQVRLPLLSPYYLYDRVEKAPIIRQTVACRELVEEAKTFHLLPDRRQELSSSRTRFRKSASKTCKRSSVLKYTSVLGKATVLFMDFRHVPELMSVIEEPGGSLQQSAVPYRLAELSGSLSVYQKFLSIPVTDDNTCSRTDRLHLLCSLSLGMTEVIVAVGGEDDRVVLRSVESFYPQARLWRSLARLPFAISKHGSVASGYNILYLAGGQYPDGSASRNVFKYDPIFDSWLEMSPMLVPRSELGLAMLDGYIYAVGGWEGSHRLESVERYDVKTNAWQLVTPMKMALTSPAVAASNGYLYVTGGAVHKDGDGIETVQRYDPRTDSWMEMASMLIARSGSAACVLNDHIFVIGGWHASTENTNKVESYDPKKNEWRVRASMKERRYRPGAAVADGKIYVCGGEEGWDSYHDTIECYDEDKDTWEVVGEMPSSRSWLSCVVLHVCKDLDKDKP